MTSLGIPPTKRTAPIGLLFVAAFLPKGLDDTLEAKRRRCGTQYRLAQIPVNT